MQQSIELFALSGDLEVSNPVSGARHAAQTTWITQCSDLLFFILSAIGAGGWSAGTDRALIDR
jgi:hypothetical protein